jgi:hypothetical protein
VNKTDKTGKQPIKAGKTEIDALILKGQNHTLILQESRNLQKARTLVVHRLDPGFLFPRGQHSLLMIVFPVLLGVGLLIAGGCSGGPREGSEYRYQPTGEMVRVLKIGTITELRAAHRDEFMADSLLRAVQHSIARFDSQAEMNHAQEMRVRDSLTALETGLRWRAAVFDDSVSVYVECCSFRQFGHLIVMPVSDFVRDYQDPDQR